MDLLARLEVDDGVGVVRMDRPPANAIDLQMGLDLQAAIAEGVERDDVGALVIWGGPKIFAAGADIKAMADWGPDEVRPSVDALGAACDLLEAAPTISIAAINGYALGGGMELAIAADLRLVADDAHLGQPEIQLGVIPGAGGTQRLTRLLGPGRAAELVFTGRQVDAQEALTLGLAGRIEPAESLFEAAVRDARAFANGPRHALAAAKAAIGAATTDPGPSGIARERALFLALFGGHDQREGMRAFVEKRPPRFGESS
ncbi:MAG TPA: enoyl-CoA hydratase-related protein [Actinomycetota bacterium]